MPTHIDLLSGCWFNHWISVDLDNMKTRAPVQLPVNQPEAEYEEVCQSKSESAKQAFEMLHTVLSVRFDK